MNKLQQLRMTLPTSNNCENFRQWWQTNGLQWTNQLRQAMIEHQNIGHDWQFTDEQKQQLKHYYDKLISI